MKGIIIVGGGTAGISVASRIMEVPTSDVVIVEPAQTHYYQPLWTLVGGGVFDREDSGRPMSDVMPNGVQWIQSKVAGFDPDSNSVDLEDGQTLGYDILVVAPAAHPLSQCLLHRGLQQPPLLQDRGRRPQAGAGPGREPPGL